MGQALKVKDLEVALGVLGVRSLGPRAHVFQRLNAQERRLLAAARVAQPLFQGGPLDQPAFGTTVAARRRLLLLRVSAPVRLPRNVRAREREFFLSPEPFERTFSYRALL